MAGKYGRELVTPTADPARSWDAKFLVQDKLDKAAAARAGSADANSFLYLVRANQSYRVGQGATLDEGKSRIDAKVLAIPSESDLLLLPQYTVWMVEALQPRVHVEVFTIQGIGGHLDGVTDIVKASDAIRAFLAK